jgi:hypothetical protein
MWDSIREACDAVQVAAAGKDEAAIRRMLEAEFRARDVSLPSEIFDSLVKRIAAGTRAPGEPLASVRYGGLLRVPFIRKAVRQMFESALTASSEGGIMEPHVSWVAENIGDSWWFISKTLPHPPGRDLYAPAPEEVPPPARLIPDPDLRERIPELFKPLPPPPVPPGWSDAPPVDAADQVFVWLEDSGGTVAVCNQPGRIGILNAEDAEAYLPLVQAALARDKVVAAMADIGSAAVGLPHSTVRVVPDRSDRGGA